MKKNKKWGSFKYLIPGIIAVILLSAVFLSNKFITKQTVGSIYNIDEAGDNFDNIQIGDEINYEVNGYSDWQVIGKDDYEGTIDVVSKTNTEDLTLDYNQTKEYYENKFQETADKYVDNNHVVSARTVNQEDLDYFNYDNDFWLNTINDTNITTSQNTWQYIIDMNNVEPNYKIYIVPEVLKYFSNIYQYNIGDVIEYSNNGINRWVVAKHYIGGYDNYTTFLRLIPETPIEVEIESFDEDIEEKVHQTIEQFSNGGVKNVQDIYDYGNYIYSIYSNEVNTLQNLIPNFLDQQTEKIIFITGQTCFRKDANKIIASCGGVISYENGVFQSSWNTIYTDLNPKSLGYRPVVTLKVKEEVQDKDKKEISSNLKVGDNVKYEAKGYKNWKVLSIDEDNNTVDIISGGIVKNITLSGKEDWDNYEDIIQREVDQYKNGDKAKKATTVTSNDLTALKEIDKGALSRYWILSKNSYLDYSASMFGGQADIIDYKIDTIYLYKYDNYEMKISSIIIYTGVNGEGLTYERYLNYVRDYTYSAGIRPVITLKLDNVEKLPDEEAEKIEEQTEKQEKVLIREQESKNKNYKGPSKVDDSTSSTGNNEVKTNDNTKDNITDNNTSNVEKVVYKDRPFYKYGFFILLVICIIETILLLIPKINKK